jgi:hypothetical protein
VLRLAFRTTCLVQLSQVLGDPMRLKLGLVAQEGDEVKGLRGCGVQLEKLRLERADRAVICAWKVRDEDDEASQLRTEARRDVNLRRDLSNGEHAQLLHERRGLMQSRLVEAVCKAIRVVKVHIHVEEQNVVAQVFGKILAVLLHRADVDQNR